MGKTTGDVVKLFLCRSCKGLFVLDSQVEKHVTTCNGDAYKSPANLFACERDHFLELVAPTFGTTTTADDSAAVFKRKTKRRKTTPRSHSAPRGRCKRRSLSESLSVDTLSQRSDSDMEIDTRRSLTPRPNTQSQTSYQQNGRYKAGEPLARSASDSIFDGVTDQALTTTQTIIVSLPLQINGNGNPEILAQHLRDTDMDHMLNKKANRKKAVYSSEQRPRSEITRTSSTPAINFLSYLSALQHQDRSCSTSNLSEIGRQAVSVLADPSVSAIEEASTVFLNEVSSSSAHHPTSTNGSKVCTTPDEDIELAVNGAMDMVEGNTVSVQHRDFPYQAVETVSEPIDTVFCDTQVLGKDTNFSSPVEDLQHVFIDKSFSGAVKKAVDVTDTSQFVQMTDELCNVDNAGIVPDIIDNSHRRDEGVTSVSSALETQPAAMYENGSVTSNITEAGSTAEAVFVNGDGFQGQILYILEPESNNLLQTVMTENGINEISQSNCSGTFLISSDVELNNLINQNDMAVNNNTFETAIIDTSTGLKFSEYSEETLQPGSTGTVTVETENSNDSSYTSENLPWHGKSHTQAQMRLLEQHALREVVLQQSTEIAPDAECKKTRYRCNVCGHIVKSVKFMHNHLQMHSDGKVLFECDQCDFKSRRKSKLTEHQQRHGRSRLLCHLCPATFLDLSSLNRHITAKHTESQKLKCDQCDFSAYGVDDLKEHKMKHTGETLVCEVEGCGYKTPYLRLLKSHQKRHTGEKNHKCGLCNFQAVDKTTVIRHMRTHTQERPYQCTSCAFRATTKYTLVLHQQRMHPQAHQPPTSYSCDKCSFTTFYPSSLTKHLKAHQTTFSCPLCTHTASTLELVKNHVRELHQLEDVDVEALKSKACNKEGGLPTTEVMTDTEKPLMEALMSEAMAVVDSSDLTSLGMTALDRGSSRIDPMKLSFHFQDQIPGNPFMSSGSGTSLTRSSSIPDLFTFSGINRCNSQSDLFTFSSINAMTRSNSMSDLVSFASMCSDGNEPVNMDVSLSDASAPVALDVVGSLSLGDGSEVTLSEGVRPDSPGGFVLDLQCCKCLDLLMNEEQVDAHKKICNGTVMMV